MLQYAPRSRSLWLPPRSRQRDELTEGSVPKSVTPPPEVIEPVHDDHGEHEKPWHAEEQKEG